MIKWTGPAQFRNKAPIPRPMSDDDLKRMIRMNNNAVQIAAFFRLEIQEVEQRIADLTDY